MQADYNQIGIGYAVKRRTDKRLARQIHAHLEGVQRLLNIGAGSGSYEPDNSELIAVEPSAVMIAQRKPSTQKQVVQAVAEGLPFKNNSFTHCMTILSMHHWPDHARALAEINRVTSEKFIALTWDPEIENNFWLTRDYFPEIIETDRHIFPKLKHLEQSFDDIAVQPIAIPADCEDGFLAAFWKRPEAYLSTQVRQSMSSFCKIKHLKSGLEKLRNDLVSGRWQENNQELLNLESLDVGYRLIIANIKST